MNRDDVLFQGGLEIHLQQLIDFFISKNYDIIVAQRSLDYNYVKQYGKIKIVGIGGNAVPFRYSLHSIINDIDADLFHIQDIGYSFPYAGDFTYGTFHGTDWDLPHVLPSAYFPLTHQLSSLFVSRWRKFNALYGVQKLKKVLSVDSSLRTTVKKRMPWLIDKVQVIPNCVDLSLFNPSLSLNEGHPSEKFTILFPRNITYARGITIALYALHLLKYVFGLNAELIVTGVAFGKPEKANSAIRQLVKTLKIERDVTFIGAIDHRSMIKIYGNSDVVIVPSLYREGTSISVLESMACGKPVICTNVGGLVEIIHNEVNGLIVEKTGHSLAQGILRIYRDVNLRNRLIENAYNDVTEKFSLNVWRRHVEKFYNL
jgi:glycosyltransferase involved in cell wall biosynthesis